MQEIKTFRQNFKPLIFETASTSIAPPMWWCGVTFLLSSKAIATTTVFAGKKVTPLLPMRKRAGKHCHFSEEIYIPREMGEFLLLDFFFTFLKTACSSLGKIGILEICLFRMKGYAFGPPFSDARAAKIQFSKKKSRK